jgi:hypothetical protein
VPAGTMLTGGWPHPGKEYCRVDLGKEVCNAILWHQETRVRYVEWKRGESKSNPDGKMEDYIGPQGRGLRYHGEGERDKGGTLIGFLNPDIGTVQGVQAELDRHKADADRAEEITWEPKQFRFRPCLLDSYDKDVFRPMNRPQSQAAGPSRPNKRK